MATLEEKAMQERIGRIEMLIGQIEGTPDSVVRNCAVELVGTIMELHGMGLERMLETAWEKGAMGQELIDDFAQDDLLRSLLLLHGLHPLDLETRVTQALDKVRPYLGSHGGNVELLGIEDGVVRLRLQGSCNGCASSAMTLKLAIEEAMQEFAPDIARMEVEGVVEQLSKPKGMPAGGFIPLTEVRGASRPATNIGRWESLGDVSSLVVDSFQLVEVMGQEVLLCRLNGTFYAYGGECPGCRNSLESAALKGSTLSCRQCGNSYDVMRAGRCLDQPSLHMEPYPLLEQAGKVKIALPSAVTG